VVDVCGCDGWAREDALRPDMAGILCMHHTRKHRMHTLHCAISDSAGSIICSERSVPLVFQVLQMGHGTEEQCVLPR
jgi:hypothetical protein